ncbi:unnamed protein product, partial [Choristocarpus tenellus]
MAALQVLRDEGLAENAFKMGTRVRAGLEGLGAPMVEKIRGRGLLNAVVIKDDGDSDRAWEICLDLKEMGLLAKPTHG